MLDIAWQPSSAKVRIQDNRSHSTATATSFVIAQTRLMSTPCRPVCRTSKTCVNNRMRSWKTQEFQGNHKHWGMLAQEEKGFKANSNHSIRAHWPHLHKGVRCKLNLKQFKTLCFARLVDDVIGYLVSSELRNKQRTCLKQVFSWFTCSLKIDQCSLQIVKYNKTLQVQLKLCHCQRPLRPVTTIWMAVTQGLSRYFRV